MLTITPWDHFGWMCALVRCQDGFYPAHGKNTLGGARTHDHKIKSLALYHLSYEGKWCYYKNRWRIRVSIPVPRACKARTLPIELIPQPLGF